MITTIFLIIAAVFACMFVCIACMGIKDAATGLFSHQDRAQAPGPAQAPAPEPRPVVKSTKLEIAAFTIAVIFAGVLFTIVLITLGQ